MTSRRALIYAGLVMGALITLVPFLLGLLTSVTSAHQFATDLPLALPKPPTLANYADLTGAGFSRAIVVTARFDSRVSGPAIPTAATTAPVSSRIGAAMQTMPSSLSSFSTAQPRWRTAASALRNLSAVVMVLGVRGKSPAATTSSITGCG